MRKYIMLFLFALIININIVYASDVVKYADCVDGDTIKVLIKDKEVTVRLLAIDTPESVKPDTDVAYYGKEASEYTCKRIKKAKKILLEYDSKSDKVDKFDRVLAWVFLDGKLLQSDLVENGYAKVAYLYDEYKYANLLKEKQELAVAKGIGIWNDENRKKYENSSNLENIDTQKEENYEVFIITIMFLLITFFFIQFKNIIIRK